jgi:replicative DNA helicase
MRSALVNVFGEEYVQQHEREKASGMSSGVTPTSYTKGGSFVFDTPATSPAVWGDGEKVAWAQGEALMLCGPSGVGKSTVAIQLVEARLGIGSGELLGMPIAPGARNVLYLAMDRPRQIRRAMARVFKPGDREILDERLVVWEGPPPGDFSKRPDLLLEMCTSANADTVIVDSLKDAITADLRDDVSGTGYNRARQIALRAGVEVLENHHGRKATGDNKKPNKIDDVYGSTWFTAGAGSVVYLWGEPGDPVVEFIHLKQPMENVGPLTVNHDMLNGRSTTGGTVRALDVIRLKAGKGVGALEFACIKFGTSKPTPAQKEKARRELDALVKRGLATVKAGSNAQPALYLEDDLSGWASGGTP